MNTANALNILLAVALVLVCGRLYYATTPASIMSDAADPDSDETVRDFHEGHTLPEAPAQPASASDFALAALGADASALPVPKADAVTTATPAAKKDEDATATREFKALDVKKDFADNPFDIFTGKGMLLCAGDREKSNAMTIGWGGLGTLWGRNDAVTVYVAEKRHTKLFMDKAATFTVMGFDKERQADEKGREG